MECPEGVQVSAFPRCPRCQRPEFNTCVCAMTPLTRAIPPAPSRTQEAMDNFDNLRDGAVPGNAGTPPPSPPPSPPPAMLNVLADAAAASDVPFVSCPVTKLELQRLNDLDPKLTHAILSAAVVGVPLNLTIDLLVKVIIMPGVEAMSERRHVALEAIGRELTAERPTPVYSPIERKGIFDRALKELKKESPVYKNLFSRVKNTAVPLAVVMHCLTHSCLDPMINGETRAETGRAGGEPEAFNTDLPRATLVELGESTHVYLLRICRGLMS